MVAATVATRCRFTARLSSAYVTVSRQRQTIKYDRALVMWWARRSAAAGERNQKLSHDITGRHDRSLGVENVLEYKWACGPDGCVPGTGGRAVLPTRIDAQLRRLAVTGVGRRGAICFVCGRRRDRLGKGRFPPSIARRKLMRTHSIEPSASQISHGLFCI